MAEPLTLAAVGAVVLNEGIKFLYGQAGEVLKRWRERKKASEGKAADTTAEEVSVQLPPILAGALKPVVYHYDRLEPLEPTMRELWLALAPYAQGLDEVDAKDAQLVARADNLRRQLETVFGQRITFTGEAREPSGSPVVVGIADVKTIAGEAAAVLAGSIEGGEVRGELKADTVEAGGKAYGVKADRIGD